MCLLCGISNVKMIRFGSIQDISKHFKNLVFIFESKMGGLKEKDHLKSILKYIVWIQSSYCGFKIVDGPHNLGVNKW